MGFGSFLGFFDFVAGEEGQAFSRCCRGQVSACAPKKTVGKVITEKKVYPVYSPPNLLPPLGEGRGGAASVLGTGWRGATPAGACRCSGQCFLASSSI